MLPVNGQLLAIPLGSLRVGNGPIPFEVEVEQVIDMGNHLHVVGVVGLDRVDLRLPPGVAPPEAGSSLRVHADGAVALP